VADATAIAGGVGVVIGGVITGAVQLVVARQTRRREEAREARSAERDAQQERVMARAAARQVETELLAARVSLANPMAARLLTLRRPLPDALWRAYREQLARSLSPDQWLALHRAYFLMGRATALPEADARRGRFRFVAFFAVEMLPLLMFRFARRERSKFLRTCVEAVEEALTALKRLTREGASPRAEEAMDDAERQTLRSE
jgi:hypothetical protein